MNKQDSNLKKKVVKSNSSTKSIVDQLFKKPKRDKGVNAPTFQRYTPNYIHQADLLFLPDDGGYKYALVVVDLGTHLTDAEPLKRKYAKDVKQAFTNIYRRKTLNRPTIIEVDPGKEFMGVFKQYCKEEGIKMKVGKPNRHRMQAVVERRNQIIGKALFKRMIEQELLTDEPSVEWVDDLPKIIREMNKKEKKKKIVKPTDDYQCAGDACNILDQGTLVRIPLDAPIDVVSGKRLHGKFRDTDIRWEIKPKKITRSILKPNKPPLYLVEGDTHTVYTKNQLQVYDESEQAPRKESFRPIKSNIGDLYVVDKILDKKKIKNRFHYLIKWKHGPETWEPIKTMQQDIPDLVKQFEENNI